MGMEGFQDNGGIVPDSPSLNMGSRDSVYLCIKILLLWDLAAVSRVLYVETARKCTVMVWAV